MSPKHAVIIRDVPSLLRHMGRVAKNEASWDDVNLDKLSIVIPVVIEGKSWDKRLDVRGAVLVQDLQKQFAAHYISLTDEKPPRDALIKVTTKEGSNWLDIDYTEVIKSGIQKMDSKDILKAICFCVFCGTAAYSFNSYLNNEKDKNSLAYMQAANENIHEIAMSVIESGQEPSRPMHRYIKTLRRGDKISIAESEFMKKSDAIQKIERPERDDVLYFTSCDGEYSLMSLDVSGELPVIHISQDGYSGKAMFFTRVPKEVKEAILNALDVRITNQKKGKSLPPPTMHLQLDGYFTNKTVKYFVILGIGTPRAGKHYSLSELPDEVAGKDKKIPGTN